MHRQTSTHPPSYKTLSLNDLADMHQPSSYKMSLSDLTNTHQPSSSKNDKHPAIRSPPS